MELRSTFGRNAGPRYRESGFQFNVDSIVDVLISPQYLCTSARFATADSSVPTSRLASIDFVIDLTL